MRLACEWLNTNVEPIAQAITARTFAENPDLQQKYGERGRRKCEEDTVYHLHYLSQAIAANRKKIKRQSERVGI